MDMDDGEYLERVAKPLLAPLVRDLKTYMPDKPCEFIAQWAENSTMEERERYFDERCRSTIESLTAALLQAKPRSPRSWLRSAHLQCIGFPDDTTGTPSISSSLSDSTISLTRTDNALAMVAGHSSAALGYFVPLKQMSQSQLPMALVILQNHTTTADGNMREKHMEKMSRQDLFLAWATFIKVANEECGVQKMVIRAQGRRARDNVQIVVLTKGEHEVLAFTHTWVPDSMDTILGVCVVPASIRDFDDRMDPEIFFDSGKKHGAIALDYWTKP